jgi:hypothetical protein
LDPVEFDLKEDVEQDKLLRMLEELIRLVR